MTHLYLGDLTQTTDGRPGGGSSRGAGELLVLCMKKNCLRLERLAEGEIDVREGVGATGDSLVARLAVPDTGGVTLDGVLAAEGAGVTGVLRDFDLLHLLTEGGAITEVLVSGCSWSM